MRESLDDVDLVYLWVDMADPTWRAKSEKARQEGGFGALEPARFRTFDELRYSLRSVERFAPSLRKVFIVTDSQVPAWLNLSHPKISMVRHEDVFPGFVDLPSFSSTAIEGNLHRIAGLSEKFLYLNDDMLLVRPLSRGDLFRPDGRIKVGLQPFKMAVPRGRDDAFFANWFNTERLLFERFPGFFAGPFNVRNVVNRARGWKIGKLHFPSHGIQAYSRGAAAEVEKLFKKNVDETLQERFRKHDSIIIQGLWRYHLLASGEGVAEYRETLYLDRAAGPAKLARRAAKLLRTPEEQRPLDVCLNDSDAAGRSDEDWGAFIRGFCEALFPGKSSFEK